MNAYYPEGVTDALISSKWESEDEEELRIELEEAIEEFNRLEALDTDSMSDEELNKHQEDLVNAEEEVSIARFRYDTFVEENP